MPECKAVNISKQDLRNLRNSQQAEDGRYIGHRCIKKTQEVKTRPGQNASRPFQERDYQAYRCSDYDHGQKSIKVIQDIYSYYEEPSNTEIVIGDVRTIPRRKILKVYVKESDGVTRNVERKCHQIESEKIYVQRLANVSMQSQIYEETRKLMVDASVGSIQCALHEIHKTKKNHNECVRLGADRQQNMQVHQKLSPTKHIRSCATSPIIATDHAIEKFKLSKREGEQILYHSTVTPMRNTADAEEYQPTEEAESVGDSAGTMVGEFMKYRFMKHNSSGVEFDTDDRRPNGATTQTRLMKWKGSQRRLFKNKQKAKQNQKTSKSIQGSNVFLSLRSRFKDLRRRLELKEKQNQTQRSLSPILKNSSHHSPSYKDDSVPSDPPSLVARPYYLNSLWNIICNNAKVKLFRSKKSLKSSLTNQGEKERKTKNYRRAVKINLKSNKNAAIREKITKKSSGCNEKGNLKVKKISSNPDAKIETVPNTLNEFKNIQNDTGSGLDRFNINNLDATENSTSVRWDNNAYRGSSSSSTIVETIDCLFTDTGLDLRSSLDISEQFSQDKHNNPFPKILPTFVLQSCEYKIPIDKETPSTSPTTLIKDSKNKMQRKKTNIRVARQKWIFGRINQQSSRTEIVLHALYNKGNRYEYYRIDIPSELLLGSYKDNGKQSDEKLVQVVNYDMLTSKIDETLMEAIVHEQLAETQERRGKFELPVCSTFIKIANNETLSPIEKYEENKKDSINNAYEYHSECTWSYANAWSSDSYLTVINSKSCPNFIENYEAYIDKYVDDIFDTDSSYFKHFKQSGMTAKVNQLKRKLTMQGREALSESYVDCDPSFLSVLRKGKLNAVSWTPSLLDGVDSAYEVKTVCVKTNPTPSHVPGILESQEDYNKDEKSLSKTRVSVVPRDGDVIPRKSAYGQISLALPIECQDRESVEKQARKLLRLRRKTKEAKSPRRQIEVNGDTIQSTKFRTIAAKSSKSVVIKDEPLTKLKLPPIDVASNRRTSTVSKSTQSYYPLFQDTQYTQFSYNSITKSQAHLKSQSTQTSTEKSFSIPKETQYSRQDCPEPQMKQNVAPHVTQTYHKNTKLIIIQKPLKGKSKSASKRRHRCTDSSKEVNNAMSTIRAKLLQCPCPKSRVSIQNSPCKLIMDNFVEHPLCTLKSVLAGKPCTSTHVRNSLKIKQTEKKNGTKRDIRCHCRALSKNCFILTSPTSPNKDERLCNLMSVFGGKTCSFEKTWVKNVYNIKQTVKKNCGKGGTPASVVAKRQYKTGTIYCIDKLSKKTQTSVKKDLHHKHPVQLSSVKVSRKPFNKQSVYTVNVPMTTWAKGEDTKVFETLYTRDIKEDSARNTPKCPSTNMDHNESKTANNKDYKILPLECLDSNVKQNTNTRGNNNYTVKDDNGITITERLDASDDEEECESDSNRTVEIHFTVKICGVKNK